jgi:hypothetical protein
MECPKCKSRDLQRPAKPRAFEIFTCRKCGEESAIHNHYPIADEFCSKHKIFRGMYFVTEANAVKDFIKLKKHTKKMFLVRAVAIGGSVLRREESVGTWNLPRY